jgi:RNA polymerase sigma factor (sigma-70 family)
MPNSRTSVLNRVVRSVAGADRLTVTDRELLHRFARENDQGAFAALVTRHTALVLGVCRRALPTVQDAEDACQATFLVLARKAGSTHWSASVANWLHATARKLAHNARVGAERRAKREVGAAMPEVVEPVDRMTGRELLAVLDEELEKLPTRYRAPLVLCYLEGLTLDEAAVRLGIPLATLKTRAARGRKRLAAALTRRGCALGLGLLALAVTSSAGASPPQQIATVLTAVRGTPSSAVCELARGVAVGGVVTRVKLAAAIGLVVMSFGLAAIPPRTAEHTPAPTPAVNTRAAPPQTAETKTEKEGEVKGTVLGPDDKPVPGAKLFLIRLRKSALTPQAIAAKDGTFALPVDDMPGSYVLATAPGYGLGWARLDPRPTPGFIIRLTAEETITGKVINLEGQPVAGVTVSVVEALRSGAGSNLDEWLRLARDPKRPDRPVLEALQPGDGFLTGTGLVPPVTSDREGKFEIRGLGRDRVVVLRITGPTTATHQVPVVTRKLERFQSRGITHPGDEVFQGSAPTVVAVPVPITTGRVLDAATGKPVPGTVLWVDRLVEHHTVVQGLKAVADKDGRFTLPGLPEKSAGLTVLVIPQAGEPYHQIQVPVPEKAAERAAFDVKLTRGIPATVKVVDQTTGQPVKSFLRYGVFPSDNMNARAVPDVWHYLYWTDAPQLLLPQSEYRIVVFPGKGLLAAEAVRGEEYLSGVGVEAFKKHHASGQLSGLALYANLYPHQWHRLREIDVPADAKEFTVTLKLDRGATATGRLVDADGKAVTGAQSFGLGNQRKRSGEWSKPAAEARFTALALQMHEKRRVMFVHTERKLAGTVVVVGGAKDPVEVRMEPWGEVTGRLVGADGKPVAGRITALWDVVRLPDLDLGSSPLCWSGGDAVTVGADGRFRITGLVPGLKYRWSADGLREGKKYQPVMIPAVIPKAGQTTELGDVTVREE